GDAGQRRDQDVARLRLPPRVDHRATPLADDLPVPDPGLRVDRLADRAQQPQSGKVAAVRVLLAPAHERADGRGRGVADRDAVLRDDAREAVLVWKVRGALVHHRGGAIGERAVDGAGMDGDRTTGGGAPEEV